MKQPILPSYTSLQAELDKAGAEILASEVHGLIAGALCGDANIQDGWERIVVSAQLPEEAYASLHMVYNDSEQQFKDFLFEFNLLLPTDDESLPFRAEALTAWCQGFLMGLKLTNIPLEKREPGELTEAIDDLIEIAKMNYEQVVASEEDEAAYVELVEYVRMAVILVYQELHNMQDTIEPSQILH